MSNTPQFQHSQSVSEADFARNEGGCARFFMIVLAIVSPLLGICFSVIYRTVGYKSMANKLLWISIVVLVLQVIFIVSIWGTIITTMLRIPW